jgi:hypothetical protein
MQPTFANRLKAEAAWAFVEAQLEFRKYEDLAGLQEWAQNNEARVATLLYSAVAAHPDLRLPPTKANIARWAQASQPDGKVNLLAAPGKGAFLSDKNFWEKLRQSGPLSWAVSSTFWADLGAALREREDAASLSVENQALRKGIWADKLTQYMKAMYIAHDYGSTPFGSKGLYPVISWLNQHYPVDAKRKRKQPAAD